jgi:glycerol kinase
VSPSFVLGIDQGSSGSKAVILDGDGTVRGYAYRPLERIYPQPGWVEQEPTAVSQGVAEAITEAVGRAGIHPSEIAACGITGQRNTAFAWNSRTHTPLANAITWQDQRTLPLIRELAAWPLIGEAQRRLGYVPGTYMASLHLAWRMKHDTAVREAAQSGDLQIGLSPAWLLTALGRPNSHAMDTSLVQAMGVYDFRAGHYWQEWLDYLGIPLDPLPQPVPTIHDYGTLCVTAPDGRSADVPVLAMIGDQQSALFGHTCRRKGAAECTHGTASYVKVFLDDQAPDQEKINVYNAWHLGQRQTYCLEAPTTVTGAAIRWMRDNARLFDSYEAMDELAAGVPDAGDVVYVPAFTGLEVPNFEPNARGTILGLTLGHHRGHIARAFFEAIGYQIRTILETIETEAGVTVSELLVGGGVSASDLACQTQADLLNLPILRPTFAETTAWAAGLLAGLGANVWPTEADLPPLPGTHTRFEPALNAATRDAGYGRWQKAISFVRAWGQQETAAH